MSDQVTNKGAVPEENPVRVLEIAPPSSMPPSDKLLSRIAILLFILVAGLLTYPTCRSARHFSTAKMGAMF
jgi:hypothetical protein